MSWQEKIITDTAGIQKLLSETKTIAVLGIKTEAQANEAAFYVPSYLNSAGFKIIPVPVYYPEVKQILGHKVYRKLVEIPIEVDLVNVFRRSKDVPAHLEDILAKSRRRCGCNQELGVTRLQRRSRRLVSKWSRIGA